MTEPAGPKPLGHRKLQLAAKAVDVNMKIDHFEAVAKAVNGVATFAFEVTFKAKEKPGEADKAFEEKKFSEKLYVHASNLDEALQILHTMGHKFKQMNRGELQQYLKRDFSQVQTRRKHDEKKGTSFHMGTSNKVSGEVRYDEVGLSPKELEDLHTYANYLQSEKALEDGVTSPEAQMEMQKISPYSEVTLEREDGTSFKVHAASIPEGTTVSLAYPTADPGLTVDLQYGSLQTQIKATHLVDYAKAFMANAKAIPMMTELLSEDAYQVYLENASGKDSLEDLQKAFLMGVCTDVEKAVANGDFDSSELVAAYEAIKGLKFDEGSIHTLLENLGKYNEIHDQDLSCGLAHVRCYQTEAFLTEVNRNEIQATGNKLELLDLYEQAFPGIKKEVLENKADDTTFTKKEFEAALEKKMDEYFHDLLGVDPSLRDEYFKQAIPGNLQITLEHALADAAGREPTPTITHPAGLHGKIELIVRNGLLLPGALLPEKDKAQEARDKKRVELLDIRRAWLKEASKHIDRVTAVIKKVKTEASLEESEVQLFDCVYNSLPNKAGFLSFQSRFKGYTTSEGRYSLEAMLAGEKKFLHDAFKIDVTGDSFEEFFANYLKYVTGKDDLSAVEETDMPRVTKVF